MSGLDLERAFLAVSTLGLGERALELSLDYARSREQFGQPISGFQLIQAKLAEMYTSLEACRAFAYRVARACNELQAGEGGRGEIHKLCAAAALFCAEQTRAIVDHAVQIHGGTGFMWESEVNRLYRAARVLEIGAGTSEIRKLVIAGELIRDD
jgi:isovaleryl-CoA dehydrogenase